MKRILLLLTLFLVGILIVWFVGNTNQQSDSNQPAAETGNLPAADEGFSRALDVQPLIFPQDHGPHPDFQTEWWYYTGNLQAEDGHRFGYQLTFFVALYSRGGFTGPPLKLEDIASLHGTFCAIGY